MDNPSGILSVEPACRDIEEQVETLLIELSARFIALAPDQVDRQIEDAQRQICQHLGLDRSSLFQEPEGEPGALLLTHVHQSQDMPPPPTGKFDARSTFPWMVNELHQGRTVAITRLDDFPREAARDRESLGRFGTRSVLVVPLSIGSGTFGCLTFASSHERENWPERLVKRLQLVGDVFTNALARAQADKALRKYLDEVRQLRDQLQEQNVYLQQEVKLLNKHTRLLGQSQALKRVLKQIEQVAATGSSVLLLGETGTGKELVAAAIHELSPRRNHAMVRLNCSAIPAALIESELFGREKGAYTGALAKQVGRFEVADKSTLFLDEIGELSAEMQVKLLRVLQEKQIERLGSPRTIPVDVRIVTATNRDLDRAVREGSFRQDLYYRLNVFPIVVPPLRDRPEDIPTLVSAFVSEFAVAFGKNITCIAKESMDALKRYAWPGNVRELRNLIERAMILAKGPKLWIEPPDKALESTLSPMNLGDAESKHIQRVLEMTSWRIRGTNGAAEMLGIKPTTLESRMAKLGIHRPNGDTK